MRSAVALCLFLAPIALLSAQSKPAETSSSAPAYTPAYTNDGRMLPPAGYRQWIYLTSGLDMSYSPSVPGADDMSMFDNAFVNPAAWQSFQQTGTWPDKTVILLEGRSAQTKGSINKSGRFQGSMMGLEVHVKDASHGGWAFYRFDSDKPAQMVPKTAACYTCHQEHAAVDTTFVQFYPTLLPIAKQKGTLSAAYMKEEAK